MRKVIIYFMVLIFIPFSVFAGDIWLHMLTTGEPIGNYNLGDKLNPSGNWYINFEVGQESWNSTEAGIGPSNGDQSNWEWRTAEWYEDGTGSNKKVRSDFGDFQFTNTGNWYINGRAKADESDPWHYANNSDWDSSSTFSPQYYFSVSELPQPTSFSATAEGSRRIDINWTQNSSYTEVMIVARESSELTADPNNGISYNVGDQIGDGTVIYKGTGEQFTHTILSENTTYYYRIYTCNNDYYSTTSTDTKQNVTTDQTPVTYHTISSFSGSEGDFGTSENVGTDGNTNFYITWDSDYLYAAIFTDDIEFAEGHEKFNIAIDIDPGDPNGASIESFGGYNFTAKNDGYHKLDYIVQWDDDFTNDVNLFDGYDGSLDGGTDKTYSNLVPDDNKAVEVRVPWPDLGGRPTSTWGIILWSCWGNDKNVSYSFPTTNPTGDASTPLAVEEYYLFNSANSGINPGADGTDQSLPIEIQSLTATADGQKVVLNWETASELDNSGFNIFRSSQENSGYYIINEELIEGAGNSSTKRSYQYIDEQVVPGNQYWYKLQDVSFSGETEMHGPVAAKLQTESNNPSAESYALYPVYPNPFNPATTIRFDMQEQADLNIAIYNLQGQKIKTLANEEYPAGSNFSIRWNGTDQYGQSVSAGVYLYKMTTSTGFQKIRKMVLVR